MAQLPHNLRDIVKDADSHIDTSSPQKVFKQLQNGVLLNQNTQDRAKGWDKPVTLKFELPNGETEQTTENLSDQETNVWIQLTVGDFHTPSSGMSGDIKISLSSPDPREKTRLVIREIDITDSFSQTQSSQEVQVSHTKSQDVVEKTNGVKLPHNYEAILKEADSPIDKSSPNKIKDQLYSGKYWVNKESGSNCFMLFARDLSVIWGDDQRYWKWTSLKETSDVFVDVAELLNVCWLEIKVRFETTKLTPRALYKVVFVIMLKEVAYGWDAPVNLRLLLPNGIKIEHKENLKMKPRNQWIEIPVGEFRTLPERAGEMEISMYEIEDLNWKKGLVIKGIVITAKE
ncbi:hypothetical protein Patl1_11877 [Pistacia atlantica]|uniref:Uncharacterized protein n=1 Tax=Pistacia atlantica TaxID=434234 RepID=A0ACC1AB16_9ROSI|nr:hypothetical protein Patl1_11877 [Pistacia atlantica]